MCFYSCVYHVSSFVLNHNTNQGHAMDLVLRVFPQLTRYDANCCTNINVYNACILSVIWT